MTLTPPFDGALRARFESMLARMEPSLRRVAASYAREAADREDTLQEVALALWRALPDFRGECSERTFVFRVAHNVALAAALRRRAISQRTGSDEVVATLADARPDPEARLDAARRKERLFEAIRALPVTHRQPLTLALEGLSHEEIGAVLGITSNNVTVRLHRARAALRELLGETP
jgi:RNA polymerase sigma-70 factor (ECF subfamily)